MIEITQLVKKYPSPDGSSAVVLGVDHLVVSPAQHMAVVGPSGSGKSTLLSMIGGIVTPSSGTILWDGEPWPENKGRATARTRARRIGFIFQDLNLLPSMSLYDNLEAAAWFLGVAHAGQSVRDALGRVGLAKRQGHKPGQLSRGERQRAAIARAMLYPHRLILADEPTASLDGRNAEMVMKLLVGIASENGSALLVATHDTLVMGMLPHRFELSGTCFQSISRRTPVKGTS